MCVVLWKLRIGFGVILQLQRVIMISALFLEQFCLPSSRYGRRDSFQVVGTPHSFAISVSSWASSVCVVLRVSAACIDLLSNASSQSRIGRMLVVWLRDRLHEEVVCRTRDKWNSTVRPYSTLLVAGPTRTNQSSSRLRQLRT